MQGRPTSTCNGRHAVQQRNAARLLVGAHEARLPPMLAIPPSLIGSPLLPALPLPLLLPAH